MVSKISAISAQCPRYSYERRSIQTFSRNLLRALVLLSTMNLGIAAAQANDRQGHFGPGRIIVKTRRGVDDAHFAQFAARRGIQERGRMRAARMHLIDVPADQAEVMAAQLRYDPEVEFAEVDRLVPAEDITANDPYFSNAWHLQTLGAPTAWAIAKGDGVIVAVLDSGVDGTHPDLKPQLVPGWNVRDNNSDTSDVYGHGTEVAGVVGAASNNGLGVTSIAWNTKIMPIRVSETNGSTYLSVLANGIVYAADHGAKIANCSFASVSGSPTIQNAANYMRSKGGLVVVAAGNSGGYVDTANSSSLISVSATDSNDNLTSWSSYGPYVDVSAPGEGIWSTTRGGGYAAVSGTSFSSPVVAAVLALMESANPALTNVQLESLLKSTAVDRGTPGYDIYYGYGRVSAAAAVAAARNYGSTATATTSDTTAPSVSIASPTSGTLSGTVTVSANASDSSGIARVDLYAGTALLGSASVAPYNVSWNTRTVANGLVSLKAYAYDKKGNKAASAAVSVNVANDWVAPSLYIANPPGGSTLKGTVAVFLWSSDIGHEGDSSRGIAQLSYSVDGKVIATTSSNMMYASYWNTLTLANGIHTFAANATDESGNLTTKTLSIKISN
ncbi:MAG: S8 family peptidase [Gammaproteobacteria bacterium]